MDKAYSKMIFEKAKINQAKYIYIKKINDNKYVYIDKNLNENKIELNEIINMAEEELNYPMFVKPSNSGSSFGVNKADNKEELLKNIDLASKFDTKILIEKAIAAREIECAVMGNSKIGVTVTNPGEILASGEFYSYDSKYNDRNSKTVINAEISNDQKEKIKELAKKAFLAIDGNGLSRVDFFLEKNTGKIYINEINTMPGFTEISMYPKLFMEYGYKYSEILDRLIEFEMKK